jgi:hypothetical protein
MFNIYMVIFIIISVFTVAGGTYKLYGTGQTYGAVLFFAGTLYLSIVYGIRWFSSNSLFSQTPVSWPPFTNTCPDYLTAYTRTVNGGAVQTCVDMVGVSKNGTLTVFDKSKGDSNPESAFFPLVPTSTDPVTQNNAYCQQTLAAGLTWEGITNGESCVSPDGSLSGPPSSSAKCV